MRVDIVPGARLPDFRLPDQAGVLRRLSELQGDDPLILVLSRGRFCPKDIQQHRLLAAFAPELEVGYARLATITTDGLDELNAMRSSVGASWTFLADPGRVVQQALDIPEYTDPVHNPMVPHTFVLAPGLEVFTLYNGYWYWGRPSIEELRADLRAVTRRIRPDWDLGDPDLREAWSRGDRSRFFPYGGSRRGDGRGGAGAC